MRAAWATAPSPSIWRVMTIQTFARRQSAVTKRPPLGGPLQRRKPGPRQRLFIVTTPRANGLNATLISLPLEPRTHSNPKAEGPCAVTTSTQPALFTWSTAARALISCTPGAGRALAASAPGHRRVPHGPFHHLRPRAAHAVTGAPPHPRPGLPAPLRPSSAQRPSSPGQAPGPDQLPPGRRATATEPLIQGTGSPLPGRHAAVTRMLTPTIATPTRGHTL